MYIQTWKICNIKENDQEKCKGKKTLNNARYRMVMLEKENMCVRVILYLDVYKCTLFFTYLPI